MSNTLEEMGIIPGDRTLQEIKEAGERARAAMIAANAHNSSVRAKEETVEWPLPSRSIEIGRQGVKSAKEALVAAAAVSSSRVEIEVVRTPNMNNDPVAIRMNETEQRLLDAGLSWHERDGDWFMSRSNE